MLFANNVIYIALRRYITLVSEQDLDPGRFFGTIALCISFEAALVAFIKTYQEMSLNVPATNAPRGQTTSAPLVVETVAVSAMHSAVQQAVVTSPRQSPMPMVSGSPVEGTPKRPAPVIVPAPRNFTARNFCPANVGVV